MKIYLLLVLASLLLPEVSSSAADQFNRQGWIEDFQSLKIHISSHYAHLDDKVRSGIDPYELNLKTTSELKAAKSNREALIALMKFVAAFRDGHFKIQNLDSVAPKYLGERKKFPIRIKKSQDIYIIEGELSAACKLENGDQIVSWGTQPIHEAFQEVESMQNAYNIQNRLDMTLNTMTKGYLISSTLEITGLHSGKKTKCKISAKHVKTTSSDTKKSSALIIYSKTHPTDLCESLGILKRPISSSVPLHSELYKTIRNPTFKVGTIGSHGYLFLPAFGLYGYRSKCESKWEEYRKTFIGQCDDSCLWKFEYNIMRQALTDDLALAVKSLNTKSIKSLIVDITNNGGGNDWVDTVARIVGSQPLNCQKVAKLKNKKIKNDLEETNANILKVLAEPHKKSVTETLEKSSFNIKSVLAEFGKKCNRENYWTVKGFKPDCNILTTGNLFACGLVPYARPDTLADLDIRQSIFKSSDFNYEEQLFKGGIIILTNRNTSSSAEEFVSLLRDNIPSTKVIGEHTNSTGCGYMNGGNPITLINSGLTLNMSNCVRYQKNGTNEVFGNYPDIELNWDNASENWIKEAKL